MVDPLMTEIHALLGLKSTGNLPGTPFHAHKYLDLPPEPPVNARVCFRVMPRHHQRMSLFVSPASQTMTPAQFPTDGRRDMFQYPVNSWLTMPGFLQGIILVLLLFGMLHVATHLYSSCFDRLEKVALLPTDRIVLTY